MRSWELEPCVGAASPNAAATIVDAVRSFGGSAALVPGVLSEQSASALRAFV